MRNIIKILLIIYLVFLFIFLIVEFTPLEFTVESVKKIFYEYTLFGLPLFGVLLFGVLLGISLIKKKYWNVIAGIGLGITGIFILNSIAFSSIFWHRHSVWETKEVIAVNKENNKTIIVEQWIDSGALGYSKGIFKTRPITPFLSWKVDYYGKKLDNNWKILVDRKLEIGY